MDDSTSPQNLFEEFINRHLNTDILGDGQLQHKIAELHSFISSLPPDTQRDMWARHLTETQNDFRLLLPQVLLRSVQPKRSDEDCISVAEARLLMTLAITFAYLNLNPSA